MQRSVRKRRLVPQQDAEQHIKLRTDKAGLEEHFIDQFKGIGEFIRFAIRLVCYLYEQFQVTNEQYNPEAVEEERLPLDLSSLKTSITDRSSTEVTNEQYNPEAVEEERLPLELTSLKTSTTDRSSTEVTNEQYNPEAVEEERLPLELTSLKTSTTDRSSTEVTNEQYNPEAVEEERLPLELTSLKTSTTDRSSTELFTVRGYSLVDYPDTDEEDEDFIQNCDEGNPKLRITEDVLIQTDLAGSDVSTADSEEEYVPNPREGESTDSEGSIEIPIIKKSNGVIQDTEESEGEASMSSLPGKFLTKHQKSAKKRALVDDDIEDDISCVFNIISKVMVRLLFQPECDNETAEHYFAECKDQ
ncbi:hypothetical protein F7725_000021 [Dissostichus mawsoni]|uniref:Uncharacterized protein n=1 Tax=Dissostichus mawsoni TaxID=36200 RepID=A0A7J5ZHI2_DISMA|nr:hypothetical protein F7725_000021 [Dissostichus mawsoni]